MCSGMVVMCRDGAGDAITERRLLGDHVAPATPAGAVEVAAGAGATITTAATATRAANVRC